MCYAGNTNHWVYISVFVNVYVAIYFLCLGEITIYKTHMKRNKIRQTRFHQQEEPHNYICHIFTVLLLPQPPMLHSLSPFFCSIFLCRIHHHLTQDVFDLFMCCLSLLKWKPITEALCLFYPCFVSMPTTVPAHSRCSISTDKQNYIASG